MVTTGGGEKALIAIFINDIPSSLAVAYLIKRFSALMVNDGPEFLVRQSEYSYFDDKSILLIDAENDRLLAEAENCQLLKPTINGDMLPFVRRKPSSGKYQFGDLRYLLNSGEKIKLAMQILSRVTVKEEDLDNLDIDLKKGEPLVSQLSMLGIISDIFPLHDMQELHTLGNHWHSAPVTCFEPSYDHIRDYFGEKIAIYFAFLGYYTKALILPSCLALYNCFLWFNNDNVHAQAPFAAFNLIYLTIFLKFWKRRCSVLSYRWGTYGFQKYEKPRPDFKGQVQLSPVTREMEIWFPRSTRYRIMICETYPIVAICLFLALLAMWGYFIVQLYVEREYSKWTIRDFIVINIPTIIYSIVIEISNRLYKNLAYKLTCRENHRLPSEHEYHYLVKLISFQFVNCFCYLFYVAFILQDMTKLRRYLACVLITWQIVQQILECVIPFLRIYLSKKYSLMKLKKDKSGAFINDIILESNLDIYEDTFDDYLEMWCQFGYAFMFSSVFPMAAFYAFANNLLEMRCDAFKICMSMRRPFPQHADSMGIWQNAFEVLVVIAVMTNCALLGMTASSSEAFKNWPTWHIVVLFVLIEHGMLFVQFVVSRNVADTPEHIRIRLARAEYLEDKSQNCCVDVSLVSMAARKMAGAVPSRKLRSRAGSLASVPI